MTTTKPKPTTKLPESKAAAQYAKVPKTIRTATKGAARDFDAVLLEVVAAFHQRIAAFTEHATGIDRVEVEDRLERLAAFDSPAATAATTEIRRLSVLLDAPLADNVTRHGAARLVTAQTGGIFAAVAAAQLDPAIAAAVTHAQAEIDRIGTEYAQASAALQAAVTGADIEAVMKLRPEVEVRLPSALDQARLALLDAQDAANSQTIQHAERLHALAEQATDTADTAVMDASQRLDTLKATAAELHATRIHAHSAAAQAATALHQARAVRAALAASIDTDRERRFRRLAGLPDDTHQPDDHPPQPVDQPPQVSGFIGSDGIDRAPYRPTQTVAAFAASPFADTQ